MNITPNITYNISTSRYVWDASTKQIKTESVPISLSGSAAVSFSAPSNSLTIKFSSDIQLDYWDARVTFNTEDYDIGLGVRAAYEISIASNVEKTKTIAINSTNFTKGDGTYRIGLYGKGSSANGSVWDVTYILIDVNGLTFKPSDSDAFEVLTARDAPES